MSAMIIVAAIFGFSALFVSVCGFGNSFATFRYFKRNQNQSQQNLIPVRNWIIINLLQSVFMVLIIVLGGVFVNRAISISLGALIAIVQIMFDGSPKTDVAKLIKRNKLYLLIYIISLSVFMVMFFMLLMLK